LTIIAWAEAGIGPRLLPLGFLLAVAASRGKLVLVDAVLKGYNKHITLNPNELEQLPSAVYARPLTIQCWEVSTDRKQPAAVVDDLPSLFEKGEAVAERARKMCNNTL
jgi:Ser/Thr protein kinase RdoA (MazF antagonist)